MTSPFQNVSLWLVAAFLIAPILSQADEAKKDVAAAAVAVQTKLSLPTIFTDHMVLQRERPIVVWGSGTEGRELKVSLGEESASTTVPADGQWELTLKPRPASADPLTLIAACGDEELVVKEILVGDVWVGSGQSNMAWSLNRTMGGKEHIAAANHSGIRLYQVPNVQAGEPAGDIKTAWQRCTSANAPGFSAVLYHFGNRLHEELSVPIGLINSSWGGSPIEPWTVTETTSGKMYNGMIAPLSRFPIRGCIWYQGETNVIRKNGLAYEGKMKDLISGWRKHWGAEMPFYFVQIAPWSGPKYEAGQLPALWEAQAATLKMPHTGMAVITDLVDKISDIHPQNKKDVGARLALWALAKDYGKDVVFSGPLFREIAIEGNTARVTFAHAGGLKSRDGKPLNEFELADVDGKFVPATAEVDGDTVVVRAEGVKPVTVRFGWHKLANPNLVNGAGLPAAPFQSKNWTGGTGE